MTKLLLKLFIKNYQAPDCPAVRGAIGSLSGIVGISCNIILFIAKFAVGFIATSAAIMADAVNNLLDASSSIVTLLGFRMAQRPADHGHPFGHGRYEYLAGLLVSGIILLSGGDQARTAVEKMIRPTNANFSTVTFIVLFLSIGVKLWMSVFYKKLGKQIQSSTLLAASIDSRNDVLASTSVLLCSGVEYLFQIKLDAYAAFAVSLFILYSGIKLTGETISPLLGKKADDAYR